MLATRVEFINLDAAACNTWICHAMVPTNTVSLKIENAAKQLLGYHPIIKDFLHDEIWILTSFFQSNRHVYIVQTMLQSRSGILDLFLENNLSKYKRGGAA